MRHWRILLVVTALMLSPPKPRNGSIASGAGSRGAKTGPSLDTATVTLSSPQKSTSFCDEKRGDVLTLNQRVQGSSPCAPTNKINKLEPFPIGAASQPLRLGSIWEATTRYFAPLRTLSPHQPSPHSGLVFCPNPGPLNLHRWASDQQLQFGYGHASCHQRKPQEPSVALCAFFL
jgi:hypothetical protein